MVEEEWSLEECKKIGRVVYPTSTFVIALVSICNRICRHSPGPKDQCSGWAVSFFQYICR